MAHDICPFCDEFLTCYSCGMDLAPDCKNVLCDGCGDNLCEQCRYRELGGNYCGQCREKIQDEV